MQFKSPEEQVAMWIERLQEFDLDTEHRRGTLHRNADALSRRPCSNDCQHCWRTEEKDVSVYRTTVINDHSKSQQNQENDPDWSHLMQWKNANQKPTWEEVVRYSLNLKLYWARWNCLELSDGLLKRILKSWDRKKWENKLSFPLREYLRYRKKSIMGLQENTSG